MIPPRSTYRLQLHAQFDFDAASGIAEYLRDLGVSHVYCSPILQAAPGSTHGYDVVDCHRVNEELGGERGRLHFLSKLRLCGLGQVLDMFPSKMPATSSLHSWCWSIL